MFSQIVRQPIDQDAISISRGKHIVKTNAFVLVLMTLFAPLLANADDLDALKARMESMEDRHRHEIEELRAQLEELQNRNIPDQHTAPTDLQGRVAELEEEVEIIHEEDAATFEKFERQVDLDVYASIFFRDIEGEHSTFDANKLDIVLRSSLAERLNFGAEIEFERTATVNPDSSRAGDIELEQAWLEYSVSEAFRPRFGVVLIPFGKYNLNHYEPVRDLTARPIMMRRIIPTSWSDVGVGFSGSKRLKNLGAGFFKNSFIRYEAYMTNGLTAEFTNTSTRAARSSFGKDNNNNKALVGRLALLPNNAMELGISGYLGKYDDANDAAVAGLDMDLSLSWHAFEFLAEYARFDLDEGFLADGVTPAPDEYYGYYLQTNYHFWPKFLNSSFLGRDFAAPTFTTSLRYGRAHIDTGAAGASGDNEEQRWTIGFNYRPIEAYVFKLEYLFNSTKNEVLELGDNDGFFLSVNAAF